MRSFKRICCTSLVIVMENKTNHCIFSVGENLDVYRATLGHKVFQNHSLKPFLHFSIGSWQQRFCTTDPWRANPDLDLVLKNQFCTNYVQIGFRLVTAFGRIRRRMSFTILDLASSDVLPPSSMWVKYSFKTRPMCKFLPFWNSDKTRWGNSHRLQIQLGLSSSLVQGDLNLSSTFFCTAWNLYT